MIKDVRFRTEDFTKQVISIKLYEKWIKEYPEYSKYSFEQFKKMWHNLAETYKEVTCTSISGVRLPFYMGDLSLKYVTTNSSNINHNKSNIAKEPVGHLNFVTNGKTGKTVWSVDYARKFNCELPMLAFKSCRDLTLRARESFKETPGLFRIARATKKNVEAILHSYHPNKLKY